METKRKFPARTCESKQLDSSVSLERGKGDDSILDGGSNLSSDENGTQELAYRKKEEEKGRRVQLDERGFNRETKRKGDSQTAAHMAACFKVSDLEATEVAKELATSLALEKAATTEKTKVSVRNLPSCPRRSKDSPDVEGVESTSDGSEGEQVIPLVKSSRHLNRESRKKDGKEEGRVSELGES